MIQNVFEITLLKWLSHLLGVDESSYVLSYSILTILGLRGLIQYKDAILPL